MADLLFKRGLYSNLHNVAVTDGVVYFTTDTTLPRIPVATGILASLRISLHKIQKTSAFHLIPGITKITDYVFMEEDLFLMQNI